MRASLEQEVSARSTLRVQEIESRPKIIESPDDSIVIQRPANADLLPSNHSANTSSVPGFMLGKSVRPINLSGATNSTNVSQNVVHQKKLVSYES